MSVEPSAQSDRKRRTASGEACAARKRRACTTRAVTTDDEGEKPGGDLRARVEVAENASDDCGVHRIEDQNRLSVGEHLRLIRPDRGVEGLRIDDFLLLGTRTAPITDT